nr:tumor necrosis factor receptor superfamily member 21 isoform X2 [Paramormyrops kingsleyae]
MYGKMSFYSFDMLLTLLFTLVSNFSALALTPSTATEPLSTRQYYHTDPSTGAQLACDKCPAGTYVSKHCTQYSVRECSRCQDGTYTRGANGVRQCHRCRSHCKAPFVQRVPCTVTSDRVCACPPGTFGDGGDCRPHTQCGKGWGVRKKGSETEDVKCRPCSPGTFSDTPSSVLKCRTHSNCTAQGLAVLVEGSRESDYTCGALPANESSATLDPAWPTSAEAILAVLVHKDALDMTTGVRDSHAPPSQSGSGEKPESIAITDMAAEALGYDTSTTGSPQSHFKPPFDLQDHQPATKRAMDSQGVQVDNNVLSPGSWPPRRGSPRGHANQHFDINEHLPWMVVLLLLLVLVVIVVCSVKRSSRMLKKGPRQDPSSIMEKAAQKKPAAPTQVKEKWMYYSSAQGVDILKLVSTQIGSQWVDLYRTLANATEREVAAFSNGYAADHERAYAALQHWIIRDSDANLAKLINGLHRHRRIDVVEKIRCVMEDNQFELSQPMTSANMTHCVSPSHKAPECPGIVGEQSPVDRGKGFFADESEPLLRCDSTSSKDSALSRTGSFITKEKKDTVLRQVRLDPCDLQPIFDDMLHILNPEELHVIEEIPMAEDKLDRLFEIAGVKSQEASQTLLDSVYGHLPDLL